MKSIRLAPTRSGGATGRVLLIVDDPESLLSAVLAAGATQTSPVGEEHGWRLGRFDDPVGHQWDEDRQHDGLARRPVRS